MHAMIIPGVTLTLRSQAISLLRSIRQCPPQCGRVSRRRTDPQTREQRLVSVSEAKLRSAGAADRLDQIPLAHLRTAGDSLLLGDLVQLLTVAVFEGPPCLTATCASARRLLAELASRALRQMGDRPLLL